MRIFNILFLLLLLNIVSCNKDFKDDKGNIQTSPNSELNPKNIINNPYHGIRDDFDNWFELNNHRLDEIVRSEIISFEDPEIQVMIFNVIPADRKAFVWNEKYNKLLESDFYDTEQKSFINSLKEKATTSFYSDVDVANNLIDYFNNKRENGLELFDNEELKSLMINLDNASLAISGGGGLLCKCSSDSDWCDFTVDAGTCSGGCDIVSSGGCGTMWGYPCDGRCRFSIEPIK